MSSPSITADAAPAVLTRFWRRDLAAYPQSARRYAYLAIVVLTTIVLYYLLYIQYAVATSIMTRYHMTFTYFIWMSVIGNAVGAASSLIAGLADRWGRANLVVYGLLVAGVLVLALPGMTGKGAFLTLFVALSFVEGIILVATPALIRDFSPQLGRATAMGAWAIGPVAGSLVVTTVTSHTLDSSTWQDELRYAAVSALIVFVIALFGLRELSPRLRDQIMVSMRDRALVEARARGIDPEQQLTGHWRQMLHPAVAGPAFAVSVYLLLYYALVGNLVIYFSAVYSYSEQRANAVANWYWAANAIGLIVAGLVSDRLKVRKPLMIVGCLGTIATTVAFAELATRPATGYYTFATVFLIGGALAGVTYAPWMAAFTETVEERNPAATATGLAVWGWILRVVVAVSAAFVPVVVTSVTPVVDHGAEVAAANAKAAPALAIIDAHPATFAELAKYPPTAIPPDVLGRAVAAVGAADLLKVQQAQPDLAVLRAHGPEVAKAVKDGPHQWQTWWWVTLAGQIVFLPFAATMRGRWNPKRAREDAEAHEEAVQRELAKLEAHNA
ncbi:MFS transporter [Catenulispora subtropica]|uniref:Major facilitator superfamily (MFS) profile domain-containing protein n=1 Tax=Catenulispora subtropica TaxID=450798 RepID=A0ABN2S6R5_9ACTN